MRHAFLAIVSCCWQRSTGLQCRRSIRLTLASPALDADWSIGTCDTRRHFIAGAVASRSTVISMRVSICVIGLMLLLASLKVPSVRPPVGWAQTSELQSAVQDPGDDRLHHRAPENAQKNLILQTA